MPRSQSTASSAGMPCGCGESLPSNDSPATYSITIQQSSLVAILANVVQREQIGMLEIQTMLHAAQLDVEIPPDQLQGHFLAAVADGEINLAKSPPSHAALDGVARQRPIASGKLKRVEAGGFSGGRGWSATGKFMDGGSPQKDLLPLVAICVASGHWLPIVSCPKCR